VANALGELAIASQAPVVRTMEAIAAALLRKSKLSMGGWSPSWSQRCLPSAFFLGVGRRADLDLSVSRLVVPVKLDRVEVVEHHVSRTTRTRRLLLVEALSQNASVGHPDTAAND
jgi:hypothetical protein